MFICLKNSMFFICNEIISTGIFCQITFQINIIFTNFFIVVAKKTTLDLRNVLSHPITAYPLSLSHCDGSLVKATKSTLLTKLEEIQSYQELMQ